jgi:hypothetical protein
MARTLPAQEEGKMKTAVKPDFPVWEIRRHLEPGPIVLVTSKWRRQVNIMIKPWRPNAP